MSASDWEIRSIKLEMKLDGSNWTDVTADVRANPGIQVDYGISGHRPLDRTAKTGTMKFEMDNSEGNSAGTSGYYTAGGTNVRSGFELNVPTRVTIQAGVKYGAAKYGAFKYGSYRVRLVGRLKIADPVPGVKRERMTSCSVSDFVYEMERHKLERVAVGATVLSGTAVQTVIDNMPVAPEATSIAAGQETFAYFGDSIQDERTTAMAVIQKICMSEFGYAYVQGDGTFVFEDRHARVNATSLFTLESELVGMDAKRDIDSVVNKARVTTYPREVGASNEILFTLQRTIEIRALETISFISRYTDPEGRSARISGLDMVTPVVNTDYKFGSTEGGGANDKNADLSVTVTLGGNAAAVTLENTSGVTGYVNLFQIRGKAIRLYENVVSEIDDAASQALYDVRPIDLKLDYQTSSLIGDDFARMVTTSYAWPQFFIPVISTKGFTGERAHRMVRLDVGDRITLTENVLDIDGVDYYIHGVRLTLVPPNIVEAQWSIKLASVEQSWLLGFEDFSELSETMFLGA